MRRFKAPPRRQSFRLGGSVKFEEKRVLSRAFKYCWHAHYLTILTIDIEPSLERQVVVKNDRVT
jgi:hypothetical protein